MALIGQWVLVKLGWHCFPPTDSCLDSSTEEDCKLWLKAQCKDEEWQKAVYSVYFELSTELTMKYDSFGVSYQIYLGLVFNRFFAAAAEEMLTSFISRSRLETCKIR